MSLRSIPLSRRTFLGGAGASLALTVAHATVRPLLTSAPIQVQVIVDGPSSLSLLGLALGHPAFEAQSILLTSQDLLPAAKAILQERSIFPPLCTWNGDETRDSVLQTALVFGTFPWLRPEIKAHTQFLEMLRSRSFLYLDDPVFAKKFTNSIRTRSAGPRCTSGLCSPLDPAIEFVVEHLRSGSMGSLRTVTTSFKRHDIISSLEVLAIHQRLLQKSDSLKQVVVPLRMTVASDSQPFMSLSGSRGCLQVPLYNARVRDGLLPLRLQAFAESRQKNDLPHKAPYSS